MPCPRTSCPQLFSDFLRNRYNAHHGIFFFQLKIRPDLGYSQADKVITCELTQRDRLGYDKGRLELKELCEFIVFTHRLTLIQREINTDINMYITCIFIPQICPLWGPGSNDISVTMNTPSVQILASNYHSPLKEIKVPWGHDWLQTKLKQGKYQMSPEHVVMPESKDVCKNEEDMSKGHKNQLEQISTEQFDHHFK